MNFYSSICAHDFALKTLCVSRIGSLHVFLGILNFTSETSYAPSAGKSMLRLT